MGTEDSRSSGAATHRAGPGWLAPQLGDPFFLRTTKGNTRGRRDVATAIKTPSRLLNSTLSVFAQTCDIDRRSPDQKESRREHVASIGVATMTADGTVILDLRAEGPEGMTGHSRFVFAPSDPQYGAILEHIGGLQPGKTKPVPPWP
jgi:hypothetical protein